MTHPIAIIGAGIAGLTAARALAAHQIPSVVLERAPELREIGAGILLTPNASAALDAVDLFRPVLDGAFANEEWIIFDPSGKPLVTMPSSRWDYPSLSLARSTLQASLFSAVCNNPLVEIRLGYEAVSVAQASDHAVVRFTNGETFEAAVVIGADGHRSVVRQPGNPPRFAGYTAWRAIIEGVPSPWKNGFLSESWGAGMRFGIAPLSHDHTYWYATLNGPSAWKNPDERRDGLLAAFTGWHDPVATLIAATSPETIIESAICDSPPLAPMASGRCVVIGDAAHALTPNLGQGAAMAIEDAVALAECLAKNPNRTGITAFATRRLVRKAAVSVVSHTAGIPIQSTHPAVVTARDALLRHLPRALTLAPLDVIYSHKPKRRRPAPICFPPAAPSR